MLIKEYFTSSTDITLGYALTLPTDYKEGEHLPMIVFLHGVGERGNDIDLVEVNGIPKLFMPDNDYRGYRVITLSPQCPVEYGWNKLTAELMELIEGIAEKYGADRTHIALTGISMGGFGTWEMAMTYPHYFSCICPICGGGSTWRAGKIAHLPTRVFHSEFEKVVPVQHSIDMVNAVNACGGKAELVLYDSEDHNCWDRTYTDTDIIPWLMTASPEGK